MMDLVTLTQTPLPRGTSHGGLSNFDPPPPNWNFMVDLEILGPECPPPGLNFSWRILCVPWTDVWTLPLYPLRIPIPSLCISKPKSNGLDSGVQLYSHGG